MLSFNVKKEPQAATCGSPESKVASNFITVTKDRKYSAVTFTAKPTYHLQPDIAPHSVIGFFTSRHVAVLEMG